MDTNKGYIAYLCKNEMLMEIISAREFRANQSKYLGMAYRGEDVILKSRGLGSFRLIPVSSQDKVADKDDLTKRIGMALREVKLMKEGKIKEPSIENLLNEL